MTPSRVKIVCPNLTGHDCTITYVDTKGVEVDISNVVRAVSFKAEVGKINEATLELVKVEADVEGVADVTALGDEFRQYLKGEEK